MRQSQYGSQPAPDSRKTTCSSGFLSKVPRQIKPKLPVALMTGGDDAFAAGTGFPVLRKPFAHEELVETLNRMLPGARR